MNEIDNSLVFLDPHIQALAVPLSEGPKACCK